MWSWIRIRFSTFILICNSRYLNCPLHVCVYRFKPTPFRNELLEDFNEQEGAHYMMAEMVAETIPDDMNQQQNIPCPGCSMPLSYGTDDFDYPTCSNCRIALSVSANVLADSYQVRNWIFKDYSPVKTLEFTFLSLLITRIQWELSMRSISEGLNITRIRI